MTNKEALIDSMVLVATASNNENRKKAQELVDHYLKAYESENIQNVIKESDKRLKENIVDAKSQWDDIKALRIRNFNFKSDSSKKKMLGLVAQEAESVCPSLVKTQTDFKGDTEDAGTTTKVLKYSILYMKAIKALQEAITKIETLETKVAALEAA